MPTGRAVRENLPLAAIAAAALVARVVAAIVVLPKDVVGDSDGVGYHELAVAVRHGHLLGPNLFVARPPGLPYVAGLAMTVFGETPWVLVGVSILACVAMVVLVAHLGKVVGLSRSRQLLLAGFVAFDPALFTNGFAPVSDALHAAAVTAAVVALLVLRRQPGRRLVLVGMGAAVALAVLVKPVSLLFWAVMAVFLLSWRQRVAAVVVAACGLVPVLAWTARNDVDNGIPTYSTIGVWGLVFYRAGGIETRSRGVSFTDVVVPEFEARLAAKLGKSPPPPYTAYAAPRDRRTYDAEVDLAVSVIKAHPLRYLAATPVGLFRLTLGDTPGSIGRLLSVYYAAVYGFALWGWVRVRRDDRSLARLCIAIAAYFTLSLLVLETAGFGGTRQAMPFLPLMYLLALWPRRPSTVTPPCEAGGDVEARRVERGRNGRHQLRRVRDAAHERV